MLEVKDIKNKKYSLISEFPNANIAVVRHNLCNYKYEVHTSKFVAGKGPNDIDNDNDNDNEQR